MRHDKPFQGSGLMDKLYWRWLTPSSLIAHCFKRHEGGEFRSLCGPWSLTHSRGQAVNRPPAMLRCGVCDGMEMERRGWQESGPDSSEWGKY